MNVILEVWRIFWGLLLELSDQGAYQRYLVSHSAVHSAVQWRRFSDIRMKRKYSNAKCC